MYLKRRKQRLSSQINGQGRSRYGQGILSLIILLSLTIIPLLVISSFEFARLYLAKQELQNASDAAALTGAAQLASSDNSDPTQAHLDAIAAAIGSEPLVIADGHHRYETSLAYRDERRAADGSGGEADATLCYVVELSDEQLTVRPIHRLVHGFGDLDLAEALGSLDGSSVVGTASADEVADGRVLLAMRDAGAVAVVGRDGSAVLVALDPASYEGVDDLDSARLAEALRRVGPHELTYQHGTDRAQAAVADGTSDWAVLIRPVTVAAIEANAHSGDRMPPKSTFFYPKPRTGIVFRPLG